VNAPAGVAGEQRGSGGGQAGVILVDEQDVGCRTPEPIAEDPDPAEPLDRPAVGERHQMVLDHRRAPEELVRLLHDGLTLGQGDRASVEVEGVHRRPLQL
jgi:hypothetical protein